MNWNHWIRQSHRWLSMLFTASVVVTSIALMQDKPIAWMSDLPLPPLFLLLLSGLSLFVLPYVVGSRGPST